MAQAKGVLPRSEDREVLYKNRATSGYFVGVKLDPGLDRAGLSAWLGRIDELVAELVARLPPKESDEKGQKVAAVAIGFAQGFFIAAGQPRFDGGPEVPSSLAPNARLPSAAPSLAHVQVLEVDVMFYVASVFEARVEAFVSQLAQTSPAVQAITLDRGYQRLDETEPFGYKDGLRNVVPATDRPKVVFVHRDGSEPYEPAWADGGTYMAYLKIRQDPTAFAALPDDSARDSVIGRKKDGTRLDLLEQGVSPREEPQDPPEGLPATAHVRKAGPRGPHDDTQIFRRGLPFMQVTADGQLQVGLNFCSFQASLEQFDVVFNDWMMSPNFPPQPGGTDAGRDALLDPARQLTAIEKAGFFFVPPHNPQGLEATLFPQTRGRPKTGRLSVHKRVIDPSDASRRFDRRGFGFRVLDAQGQAVPGAEFSTDETGRAICPVDLDLDSDYILDEVATPTPDIQPQRVNFTMAKPNELLRVENQVPQPNSPYGAT